MNINLLLAETNRSKLYLDYMFKNKIKFCNIVYYSKKKNNVYKYLKRKKIKNSFFLNTHNVNSKKVEKILKKIKENIIYSGYPGEIVRNKKILKKSIYHLHPGDLPYFKGSTTLFYSILLKKKIVVSCFRINQKIDDGKVVFKKVFKTPKNKDKINSTFDDEIRAKTLVEFIKFGSKLYKKKKKQNLKSNLYYIAHPLLRYIVIKKDHLRKTIY